MTESAPCAIKAGIGLHEALGVQAKLHQAGAAVDIREAEFDLSEVECDVMLYQVGENKVEVIEVVRELTGLALAESQALADSAPCVILRSVPHEEAKAARAKLRDAGATADIEVPGYPPEP